MTYPLYPYNIPQFYRSFYHVTHTEPQPVSHNKPEPVSHMIFHPIPPTKSHPITPHDIQPYDSTTCYQPHVPTPCPSTHLWLDG